MLHRHDKYPISCVRRNDAIGADALSLRASTGRPHQGTQRAAVEFALFDLGRDPAAVGGAVRLTRILPLGSLSGEPRGAGKAVGRAAFGGHRSASEGFAHQLGQNQRVGLVAGQLAQHFQAGRDVGDQHDDVAPLAWVNAVVGWARSGERRHLANVAGAVPLLALVVTLAAGA